MPVRKTPIRSGAPPWTWRSPRAVSQADTRGCTAISTVARSTPPFTAPAMAKRSSGPISYRPSPAGLAAVASSKAPISPWKVNAGLAWTRPFSPETLTAKLKNVAYVGTITQVEIVSRDTNDSDSHAVKVRITGTTGSKTIAARVFRAKLGLPSTLILTVTMPDAPAAGVTRYQQTDSHLDWAGSWETFKTDGASAGSYKRAGVKGATVTATFKGTYLAWIATKGTTLGKAYVSVDGKTAVKIDLSAAATAYRQNVWDTGTLKSGVHKVKIWWYPSNKAGRFVSIDAFEVKGTLQ